MQRCFLSQKFEFRSFFFWGVILILVALVIVCFLFFWKLTSVDDEMNDKGKRIGILKRQNKIKFWDAKILAPIFGMV